MILVHTVVYTERNTMAAGRVRKKRISISISQNSAEFLRKVSKAENAHVSAVVEQLIEERRLEKERARLNASIAAHYDSLSDSTSREDAAWGELGATGLAEMFENETEQDVRKSAPTESK
jgi:hypothetical protein